MNNKGQTLVIFVIILPILLALCAFVIDTGLMTYESVKLKNTTKSVIASATKNNLINEEAIKQLYKKNQINIDNIEIKIENNILLIKNNYYISSIFGKLLRINEYEINLNATYDLNNNNLVFK